MKVAILSILNINTNSYEVALAVDGVECRGVLTRGVKIPLWHPDTELSECLSKTGQAAKYVAKAVSDYSQGQAINFPIELGDF